MPWAPDYCTAAELKAWLRIGDATDDALLAVAITTASRAVDGHCGRQFGSTGAPAVTRRYTYEGERIDCRPAIIIDDLQTTTDLAVTVDTADDGTADESLVNGTDYDLWPWNAAADGIPWTALVMRTAPAYRLPYYPRAVQVVARFGWTAVPSPVKQATLVQASRLFARRGAPFGVAGSPELGSEVRLLERLDVDVATSLSGYRRIWGAV